MLKLEEFIEPSDPKESLDQKESARMYFLVNEKLLSKMGKGKIAGQTCHGACRVTRIIEREKTFNKTYHEWLNSQEPKIILKSSEELMLKMLNEYSDINAPIWCQQVRDAGFTQIPAGSLTVVCFCPMKKKDTPQEIVSLKLL